MDAAVTTGVEATTDVAASLVAVASPAARLAADSGAAQGVSEAARAVSMVAGVSTVEAALVEEVASTGGAALTGVDTGNCIQI